MNNAQNTTFKIGGDLEVNRLGFGAMRITGDGVWGQPKDPQEAKAVLQRAIALGVNLIDTADAYGPNVSEELIAEALYPYPKDLVIATKGGLVRTGPGVWEQDGSAKHLREALEGSLLRLKLDVIDLYQLHRIDAKVPIEETFGVLADMQREGKIRHLGVSEVTVEQLKEAQKHITVVSVQNLYNLIDRKHEDVSNYCDEQKIAFIPWYPLATGTLAKPGSALAAIAQKHNAAPSQIALVWLLQKSQVMLPIPGTSSVLHLEENMAARDITLSSEDFAALEAIPAA